MGRLSSSQHLRSLESLLDPVSRGQTCIIQRRKSSFLSLAFLVASTLHGVEDFDLLGGYHLHSTRSFLCSHPLGLVLSQSGG